MANKERLTNTIKELISIDSQNPGSDESKIAGYIKRYLNNLGLKARVYSFKPRRDNLIAVLPGKSQGKSLLITPHLDTVPAGKNWSTDPFHAKIKDGKIYGLGATDCKGNLASALEAISCLVEDKIMLSYNLIFAATADEESGSFLGLIPLLEKKILRADAALVLDADDFKIITTQKGLMHLTVRIKGKKAHGAYPWLGVNAIELAARVILDLKKQKSKKNNKYLRPATVNVGTIKGGDKVNVVSDWCEFELDFRFLPGSSEKKLLALLRKIISKYLKNFEIDIQGIQDPYSISTGHPLVARLVRSLKHFNIRPEISGSEGATVITFFKKAGIPAIATGFGTGKCAHIADEYASLDNLYRGAEILTHFLKEFEFKNQS